LPEVDELHATSGRDGPLPRGSTLLTEPDGRSRKSRLYARAHRCEAGKQVKEPCAACGPMQPLWHGWGAVGKKVNQWLARVAVNASGVGRGRTGHRNRQWHFAPGLPTHRRRVDPVATLSCGQRGWPTLTGIVISRIGSECRGRQPPRHSRTRCCSDRD
jgi:hypothetical protein